MSGAVAAPVRPEPPVGPHGSAPTGQRNDIQGLRAVAVLLVVANHLWGDPVGGFIGVDVFFVVSGFLITGLLLKESERDGSFSFADFYRRRVRRIIPAATLVIVATVAATYYLFNEARGRTVLTDGVWAFFFASNWRFASTETDYFLDDGSISPLQHYWSLAVEEQFYFVWPVLILLVTLAVRRRPGALRASLLPVLGVVCVASFAYSMWHTTASPTWAYFSTFDRVWELGVGALLAVASPWLVRQPFVLRVVLGWGGLGVIAAGAVLIDGTSSFPAPWAALPVIGTAMVLLGGIGATQRHLVVLVNPLARYIGDLSYSLYLWHFPVIILLTAFWPEPTPQYYAACVGLMFLLAMGSFHLVEDPIRHSMWLEPKHRKRARRRSSSRVVQETSNTKYLVAGGVVVLALVALAMRPMGPDPALVATGTGGLPTIPATGSGDSGDGAGDDSLLDQQRALLAESLQLTDFPSFDPPLSSITSDYWSDDLEASGACAVSSVDSPKRCAFGDPDGTKIAVFGDSMAMSIMPAVRKAFPEERFRILQYTQFACPDADVAVLFNGARYEQCTRHRDWAFAEIARERPALVITSSATGANNLLASGATGEAAIAEVVAGYESMLTKFAAAGAKVAMVMPAPATQPMSNCVTRVSSPSDCAGEITDGWRGTLTQLRALGAIAGASVVDTSQWTCLGSRCPGIVGSMPVHTDGKHLSPWFSRSLAPLLRASLQPALREARRG